MPPKVPSSVDSIQLWQHLHGACAHFPIVGILLAFCFDYGSTLFRRPQWRIVGFWTLTAGALVSIPTVLSGLTGQNGWFGVDKWDSAKMPLHRNLALFSAGTALILLIWRTVRKDKLQGAEWFAYLVILLIATAAISYTGYLGAYVQIGE